MAPSRHVPLLLALALLTACGGGSSTGPLVRVPVGSSPVRGPADAWVTMVEFADFECPYCGAEEPVVQDLLTHNGANLRLVFKNFPLTSIHPRAQAAALAAECAGAQGAFWPMHDLLFAHQNALDDASLQADAQAVGVDVNAWKACLSTTPPADAIQADVALGNSIGLSGTPTFIVNGVPVVGAVPEADLQGTIDQALAKAKASGVPAAQYYDRVVLGG